ncbi:hypothetical protein EUX98_g3159 [Antrodiella citrinella]|uniref:DASH complex subunit ASK1 n=1 Tax=Antrodiella citrinella TaxID=2447956 RepID=A0A4S4MYG7_9APHY|nr:hypothetical protein EUX98_g3159 [Antrodiella citrinella]
MAAPVPPLKPIELKAPRWEPTADPNDIVIPGINTAAPPGDQIEQIEQLITIKLQNIDANFSKIQQIMANRILPAVKRYAVSTEPVREAAKVCNHTLRTLFFITQVVFAPRRVKFWTTFFEHAAQIRVPTYDDYAPAADPSVSAEDSESEAQDQTSPTDQSDATPSRSSHMFNPNDTSSDVSFRPAQAAISSTPATVSRNHAHGYGDEPTPSWSASLESPLIRLDREVQSLTRDDEVSGVSSSLGDMSLGPDESADITQRAPPSTSMFDSTHKGKGKEPQLLRQNVLLRNAAQADVSSTPRAHSAATSPLKVKGKTPNLKVFNPYLPPNSKPMEWKGVVDLKDPAVASPRRTHVPSRLFEPRPAKGSTTPGPSEDDSFDFGMSPPITMDFARLPTLGKTPKKEAAERIMKKLLDVEKRGAFGLPPKAGTESSMSSVPTPPSLSRYAKHPGEASSSVADASLESLMRRVGDGFTANYGVQNAGSRSSITSSEAPSSHSLPIHDSRRQLPAPVLPTAQPPEETPEHPVFSAFHLRDDEFEAGRGSDSGMLSDSSSDEEMNDTANPSAAFLLAAQRTSYDDDDDSSFDSSNQSMDSMDGAALAVEGAVHPLTHVIGAEDEDEFDDSFDDPAYQQDREEETLFGVPPAQRLLAQAQQGSGQTLRMLGEELLEDTMGIGAQMEQAGRVEESPTPWGRGA